MVEVHLPYLQLVVHRVSNLGQDLAVPRVQKLLTILLVLVPLVKLLLMHAVPSGGSATLRFVFEYMAYPNNTPTFAVEIPVSGSSLQTYTATLPAQGDNTFSNLVLRK